MFFVWHLHVPLTKGCRQVSCSTCHQQFIFSYQKTLILASLALSPRCLILAPTFGSSFFAMFQGASYFRGPVVLPHLSGDEYVISFLCLFSFLSARFSSLFPLAFLAGSYARHPFPRQRTPDLAGPDFCRVAARRCFSFSPGQGARFLVRVAFFFGHRVLTRRTEGRRSFRFSPRSASLHRFGGF